MNPTDPLLAPMKGAERRTIAGVQVDVVRTGGARVKRMIYPPGFRWSKHMKDSVGSDLCQHAHVGFLAHGAIHIQYGDGCVAEFEAQSALCLSDPSLRKDRSAQCQTAEKQEYGLI